MNITVYLGASIGNDNTLIEKAHELGKWIGNNGHTLVYGGSGSGLMGVLADSVLDNQGKVIGVEPQMFIDAGYMHERITELIVTPDIYERKKKMIELGDAFIAFPGGTGTLEEISEVMSQSALRLIKAPCIFYNINGYYNSMKDLLSKMISMGLSNTKKQKYYYFPENLQEITDIISNFPKDKTHQ